LVKPISNDKRTAIVKHMQAGKNKDEVATWLFINERTIQRIWSKYQKRLLLSEPLNCGRKPWSTKTPWIKIVEKIKSNT